MSVAYQHGHARIPATASCFEERRVAADRCLTACAGCCKPLNIRRIFATPHCEEDGALSARLGRWSRDPRFMSEKDRAEPDLLPFEEADAP